MADRLINKKIVHLELDSDSGFSFISFCEKKFAYQEVVVLTNEVYHKKNKQLFEKIQKNKTVYFNIKFVNKYDIHNLDVRVALVVAVGGEREIAFAKVCSKINNIKYCIIPIDYFSKFIFNNFYFLKGEHKKIKCFYPYGIFLDDKLINFKKDKISVNLLFQFCYEKFLNIENKLLSLFYNKHYYDGELIDNKLSGIKKLLSNNIEGMSENENYKIITKLLIEIYTSKKTIKNNYFYAFLNSFTLNNTKLSMEERFFYVSLLFTKLYISFFKNYKSEMISPVCVKYNNNENVKIENFSSNYNSMEHIKFTFFIEQIREVFLTELELIHESLNIVKNLLKEKFVNINFKIAEAFSNIDYEKLISENIDVFPDNSFLKIIRNFGCLNF